MQLLPFRYRLICTVVIQISSYCFLAASCGAPAAQAQEPAHYSQTIPSTSVSFEMVRIPGGSFTMGSPESEPERKPDEGPQFRVRMDDG